MVAVKKALTSRYNGKHGRQTRDGRSVVTPGGHDW